MMSDCRVFSCTYEPYDAVRLSVISLIEFKIHQTQNNKTSELSVTSYSGLIVFVCFVFFIVKMVKTRSVDSFVKVVKAIYPHKTKKINRSR